MQTHAYAAIVLCAWVGVFALDCTWDTPIGTLQFPNYACPDNATCVVTAARGPASTQHMFIPVGCCPQDLPVPVTNNASMYTKLHGCCPVNHTGCLSGRPGAQFLMGCARNRAQCCQDRICPEGYTCCTSRLGVSCCPSNTMCRSGDFFVPVEPAGVYSRHERVSWFFPDTAPDAHCIPAHLPNAETEYNLTVDANGAPLRYPLEIALYESPIAYENNFYYVVNVTRAPGVYDCGKTMCYDGDECVYRYRNVSKPRVVRNTTGAGCSTPWRGLPAAFGSTTQSKRRHTRQAAVRLTRHRVAHTATHSRRIQSTHMLRRYYAKTCLRVHVQTRRAATRSCARPVASAARLAGR
jgi:hypothetical protein